MCWLVCTVVVGSGRGERRLSMKVAFKKGEHGKSVCWLVCTVVVGSERGERASVDVS